jgi:alpha-tubulin suppressor-like RCC1 family protein
MHPCLYPQTISCTQTMLNRHNPHSSHAANLLKHIPTDKGQVWMWGQNAEGQLGLGDFSQRNQPTLMDFLVGINVVQIATGAYHTIFLTGELCLAVWTEFNGCRERKRANE